MHGRTAAQALHFQPVGGRRQQKPLIRDIHCSQHSEGDGRGLSVNATMNLQGRLKEEGRREGCVRIHGIFLQKKSEGVTVMVNKVRISKQGILRNLRDSDCTSRARLDK